MSAQGDSDEKDVWSNSGHNDLESDGGLVDAYSMKAFSSVPSSSQQGIGKSQLWNAEGVSGNGEAGGSQWGNASAAGPWKTENAGLHSETSAGDHGNSMSNSLSTMMQSIARDAIADQGLQADLAKRNKSGFGGWNPMEAPNPDGSGGIDPFGSSYPWKSGGSAFEPKFGSLTENYGFLPLGKQEDGWKKDPSGWGLAAGSVEKKAGGSGGWGNMEERLDFAKTELIGTSQQATTKSDTLAAGAEKVQHAVEGGATSAGLSDLQPRGPGSEEDHGQSNTAAPASASLSAEPNTEEMITRLVNSNEGWGTRPINQNTPWLMETEVGPGSLAETVSAVTAAAAAAEDPRSTAAARSDSTYWKSGQESAGPYWNSQPSKPVGQEWVSDNDIGMWNGPPPPEAVNPNMWTGPPKDNVPPIWPPAGMPPVDISNAFANPPPWDASTFPVGGGGMGVGSSSFEPYGEKMMQKDIIKEALEKSGRPADSWMQPTLRRNSADSGWITTSDAPTGSWGAGNSPAEMHDNTWGSQGSLRNPVSASQPRMPPGSRQFDMPPSGSGKVGSWGNDNPDVFWNQQSQQVRCLTED